MHWLQLYFDTSPDIAPALVDALSAVGALSVTLKDCADEPIYEPAPDATELWSQTRVIALFQSDSNMDQVLNQLKSILNLPAMPPHYIEKLEDQAWERKWLDNFQAMRFGQRLWICPSNQLPPEPDAINIMLDPGLAFGTGTHPTTALCLEWLDQHDMNGLNAIDYGCGSGILAIAAVKLGACHVWAVDIDEQALYATNDNAIKNKVHQQITTCSPKDIPIQGVDVVLANILANPLMELATDFSKLVRPQGQLILSGILKEQSSLVSEAYLAWFDIKSIREKGGWVCIHAERRPL